MRGKLKIVPGYDHNKFAALENLDNNGDISRARDNI
jgi:hypothetical protein